MLCWWVTAVLSFCNRQKISWHLFSFFYFPSSIYSFAVGNKQLRTLWQTLELSPESLPTCNVWQHNLRIIETHSSATIPSLLVQWMAVLVIAASADQTAQQFHTRPSFRAILNWGKNTWLQEMILFTSFMKTNCPSWMIQQKETHTVGSR